MHFDYGYLPCNNHEHASDDGCDAVCKSVFLSAILVSQVDLFNYHRDHKEWGCLQIQEYIVANLMDQSWSTDFTHFGG